jgi:hypothetical protein
LATPNYGYEKRQKELAKKRKKEEKLKTKADRSKQDESGGYVGEGTQQSDEGLAAPADTVNPPQPLGGHNGGNEGDLLAVSPQQLLK